ncbi:hypothetical protein CISIN_1g039758mg, partial [Citrus sinensis]
FFCCRYFFVGQISPSAPSSLTTGSPVEQLCSSHHLGFFISEFLLEAPVIVSVI